MKYLTLVLAFFTVQVSAQNYHYGFQPKGTWTYKQPRPNYIDGAPAMRGFDDFSGRQTLEHVPYIPEKRRPFGGGFSNKELKI